MPPIFNGRYTAKIEGSFVVFIIGMRLNKPWAIHRWLPIFLSSIPMVKSLLAKPQDGLLHVERFVYWQGISHVQYWRSFEDLERFASNPEYTHAQEWQKYNRIVGDSDVVGVWHETYVVQADQYECIYRNMPKRGLALAGEHRLVSAESDTANRRLHG